VLNFSSAFSGSLAFATDGGGPFAEADATLQQNPCDNQLTRDICAPMASVENDPKKLQNLADELAKALDERDELGKAKSA
jgi:hypothetical protein